MPGKRAMSACQQRMKNEQLSQTNFVLRSSARLWFVDLVGKMSNPLVTILVKALRQAIFCIQKVEPGVRDYRKQLQELRDRIGRFVDHDAFTPLDLLLLMNRMDDKTFKEIRRRRYRGLDANGGLIDVTSPTESEDIYDGGLYEVGRDNYKGAVASLRVNSYWIPVEKKLEREIHTIFPYKQAVNAVVFTQRCTKSERDYVLSRIETIARGKP
jgi:hypothetical protein